MSRFNKILAAILAVLILALIIGTGCRNKSDSVQLYGHSSTIFDDQIIRLPEGYFLDKYAQMEEGDSVYLILKFNKE